MTEEPDADEHLQDVKAVLLRVQRLGDAPPSQRLPGKGQDRSGARRDGGSGGRIARGPLERAGLRLVGGLTGKGDQTDNRIAQGRRLGGLALALIAGGTVVVLAGDLFFRYGPNLPSNTQATGTDRGPATAREKPEAAATPAVGANQVKEPTAAANVEKDLPLNPPPPPTVTAGIGKVRELLGAGHVTAARALLSQPQLAASQEGAWLLARSYDPNYLAALKSADAEGDKDRAAEWYRRWRDIAAKGGMVMDDARLKRLIETMD